MAMKYGVLTLGVAAGSLALLIWLTIPEPKREPDSQPSAFPLVPSAYTMTVELRMDSRDYGSVRRQVRYADSRTRVNSYGYDGALTRIVIGPQSGSAINCSPELEECRYRVVEFTTTTAPPGVSIISASKALDDATLATLGEAPEDFSTPRSSELDEGSAGGINLPNVVEPAAHYKRPIAGERATCTVWSSDDVTWETCRTDDGIELYRRRTTDAGTQSQLAVDFRRSVPDGIFIPPYAVITPTATP